MDPRLLICDPSLRSSGGHYLGYAERVAAAAAARGMTAAIAAHVTAEPPLSRSPLLPIFPDDYWTALLCGSVREGHAHLARSVNRWHAAVTSAIRRGESGTGDVLFFTSASLVDALGLVRLAEALGTTLPRSVLLFRREFEEQCEQSGLGLRAGAAVFRQALASALDSGGGPCIRLFTDTTELAEEYAEYGWQRFQAAPIPVASAIATTPPRADVDPFQIVYVGDARREKGFQHLPAMVRRLPAGGRMRVVVQANTNVEGGEPGMASARDELRAFPHVTVLDEVQDETAYASLLARANLVVLPYEPALYRSRSSGIFAEAVCAGVPVVVPAGTWMAGQLLHAGAGVIVPRVDGDELAGAVEAIAAAWPEYRARAAGRRETFASFHSAPRLTEFVCGRDALAAADRARAERRGER